MKQGTIGKPMKITKKNILKLLTTAKKILDEQDVPTTNRKIAYWDPGKDKVIIKSIGGDK